jgi:hypothetical protein
MPGPIWRPCFATHPAFLEHERVKAELKAIMPEDAKEAIGHGIRVKRSNLGRSVSFDLLGGEVGSCTAPVRRSRSRGGARLGPRPNSPNPRSRRSRPSASGIRGMPSAHSVMRRS